MTFLTGQWPQFAGNEKLPLTTFVKADPNDRPDIDSSSARGWQTISTRSELNGIIAAQRKIR